MEQLNCKNQNRRVIGIAGNDTSLLLGGISFDVPAPLLRIDEGSKLEVKFTLMRCKQISKIESLNLRNT